MSATSCGSSIATSVVPPRSVWKVLLGMTLARSAVIAIMSGTSRSPASSRVGTWTAGPPG